MKKLTTIVALLLSLCVAAHAQVSADLVITNANVHTMDKGKPAARSIAILNGKIIAVGSDADTRSLIGRTTRLIDAGGKVVMPGFNDAHTHFLETGVQLSAVDLRSAKSPQEFVQRLKEFASKTPKGRWILGGKWDHENWSPADLPTAAMIDAATPDNPVFIDRLDGHMGLANSLAMKLAGVGSGVKDVDGGVIIRDPQGVPTGIFKDAAMDLIQFKIPPMSNEERADALLAASEHAASLGVTSVTELGYSTDPAGIRGADIGVYQELARSGRMKTRIYACSPLSELKRWTSTGVHAAFGDTWLRTGCLKGYSDGSLGSRTAWMFEPYLDDAKTSGLAGGDVPTMFANLMAADKAGLQVMVHAIGEKANATVLDFFKSVEDANGARDRRFRIEHAQHLRPQEISRFAKEKVIASMQPVHLTDDGRWAGKRLDEKRLKGSYAFRSLLDSGAMLAFGTDSPVAPLNPFFGIYAAVTRQTTDGKNPGGWIPEQKITVDEAVRAYTVGSAYAEFQENDKGTLAVGKLADLIIISDDIFTIDPVKIANVTVLKTIVDGKVVYEAK